MLSSAPENQYGWDEQIYLPICKVLFTQIFFQYPGSPIYLN